MASPRIPQSAFPAFVRFKITMGASCIPIQVTFCIALSLGHATNA